MNIVLHLYYDVPDAVLDNRGAKGICKRNRINVGYYTKHIYQIQNGWNYVMLILICHFQALLDHQVSLDRKVRLEHPEKLK